jgi:uncharacterized protein (DUF2345 family)
MLSRARPAWHGWAVLAAVAGSLVCSFVFISPAAALDQKLTAADGAPSDFGGSSVAIDGDTLVLGAPGSNGSQGAVYVYQRSADTWTQTAKLTASDGVMNDQLGNSVAIQGDTIVAGAPGDNGGQGSAYTFTRSGGDRTQTAKLTASDGGANNQFGRSVAIDGDTIVVGAFAQVGVNAFQGAAYTFTRSGGDRTQTAKLTASDGVVNSQLGSSVAIDGDTIVVGSRGANSFLGAAYTFARSGGDRVETAKLTASDATSNDQLGTSVAIDGDTIVAGAAEDGAGSAYTFTRGGGARTQTAKLTASDGAGFARLGQSVAIDGNTILVGADTAQVGMNAGQGAAYTFTRSGVDRTETGKLTDSDGAAGDNFGRSVAIEGTTMVVGAYMDDVGANTNQGSARVFFSATPPPPPTADTDPPETTVTRGPGQNKAHGYQVTFRLRSDEAGSTFQCKLDRKSFKPCTSPKKVRAKKGRHKFLVRAVDAAGNVDPTPARSRFKVPGRKSRSQ